MTIRIRLRGGRELTGPTITAAIRDAYGPTAEFWPSRDHTSPEAGMIVSPVGPHDPGTFNVLGDVLDIEEGEA